MRWLIVLIFLVGLLSSCSKEASDVDDPNTFTMASGVKLVDNHSCIDEKNTKKPISIEKNESGYLLNMHLYLNCNEDKIPIERPVMSSGLNKRATVIIRSKKTPWWGFSNSCVCKNSLSVQISSNRLESGDTLYVVVNEVAIGHLIAP